MAIGFLDDSYFLAGSKKPKKAKVAKPKKAKVEKPKKVKVAKVKKVKVAKPKKSKKWKEIPLDQLLSKPAKQKKPKKTKVAKPKKVKTHKIAKIKTSSTTRGIKLKPKKKKRSKKAEAKLEKARKSIKGIIAEPGVKDELMKVQKADSPIDAIQSSEVATSAMQRIQEVAREAVAEDSGEEDRASKLLKLKESTEEGLEALDAQVKTWQKDGAEDADDEESSLPLGPILIGAAAVALLFMVKK